MTHWLVAIPLVSALLVLAAGTTAQAQMPGPADAEVIPPWAWSVAVGGLLALVAVLGSALVTLAARYTVAQLRRLDSMEESIRSMRDEVRQMNALSARMSSIEHVCKIMHSEVPR